MTKSSFSTLALLGFIAVPALTFAATYEYVDTSGNVRTVEADNSAQAQARATNIAPRSGVSLHGGAGASASAHAMHGGTDTKAASLRVLLNALNREHANLASETLRHVHDNDPSTAAAAGALDKNSIALAQSVGSVYGPEAEKQFLEIWRSHIGFFVEYSTAARAGDESGMARAEANLAGYVNRISDFLSGANPNLPRAAVHQVVSTHVALLKSTVDAHADGDFTASHSHQRATDAQIGTEVADTLAGAIVKQFPAKF
ncbi:MAG TPA: hypothetical protein VGB97_04615 [Candidatus Paceibacterota bacterium]